MKLFISILGFLSTLWSSAQCNNTWEQDDPKDKYALNERHFSPELIQQLKGKTLVFYYKKNDLEKLDQWQKCLESTWNFGKILLAPYENSQKYLSDSTYCHLIINNTRTDYYSTTRMQERTTSYTGSEVHYYLTLFLGKNEDKLCRIELFPDSKTLFKKLKGEESMINFLYSEGNFYNWTPTLLKSQLKVVLKNLEFKRRACLHQRVKDPHLMNILASDTLYIPEVLMVSYNPFSGKDSKMDENVFKNFPAPYRKCTEDELYQIFEVEKRGRFMFEFVKSSSTKFVSIYDNKDDVFVYRDLTEMSYNLKKKDVQEIVR